MADFDWMKHARCKDQDPDKFLVHDEARQRRVARFWCRPCPVEVECGAYALERGIRYGVFGGMTAAERRAVLKRARKAARA